MGRARLNKADAIQRARRGEAGMCQRRPLPVSSMWTPQPSGLDSLGYERRGGYRRLPLTMRGVSPNVNTGFSGRWRRSNLTLSRPVGKSTQAHGRAGLLPASRATSSSTIRRSACRASRRSPTPPRQTLRIVEKRADLLPDELKCKRRVEVNVLVQQPAGDEDSRSLEETEKFGEHVTLPATWRVALAQFLVTGRLEALKEPGARLGLHWRVLERMQAQVEGGVLLVRRPHGRMIAALLIACRSSRTQAGGVGL